MARDLVCIHTEELKVGTSMHYTSPEGGKRSTRTATVDLWVDKGALMELLGRRALRSKSGKAVLLHGFLQARVRRSTAREGTE